MPAVFDASAVACHEVKPAIVAAKDCMRIVVAAGVELVTDATPTDEIARAIAFVELNAIAADGVEAIAVNEQTLWPAPAQVGRDDFKAVEHAVVVAIDEPSNCFAIAHQESSFTIKSKGVAAAGQVRAGRA